MAEIVPTITNLGNGRLKVAWGPMVTGDVGTPFNPGHRHDKTVTIKGTATTVAFQGSNEQAFGDAYTLEDVDGTAITAAGIYTVEEHPALIRPLVTTGADVVVTVTCG